MAEGKEKKTRKSSAAATTAKTAGASAKPAAAAEVQRVQNMTAGEMLRAARMEKKLGLEEISGSIHIRVAQLRAIEEGNIEALPGMTYALGFVRSYASYLKLNSAEVVNKFKAEHGAMKPAMPELQIPTQIQENRLPDPMIVGVTAFGAIFLLLLWTIFSGGDDADVDVAAEIPPPPAVESAGSVIPVPDVAPIAADAVPAVAPQAPVIPVIPPVPAQAAATQTPVIPETAVMPVIPGLQVPDAETAANAQPGVVPLPRPMPGVSGPVAALPDTPVAPAATEEIVIKRGKGRVVLRAKQRSWVQVKDARQNVVFEKVLKPGEQYYVPDAPGMTLVTSNAGGLDIFVDKTKVQDVGRQGEIVRGVPLAPEKLGKKRVKVSNY